MSLLSKRKRLDSKRVVLQKLIPKYIIGSILSKDRKCVENTLTIPIQSMTSEDEYNIRIVLNNDTRDFDLLCTCGMKFTGQIRTKCKHINYVILSLLEKRNQSSKKENDKQQDKQVKEKIKEIELESDSDNEEESELDKAFNKLSMCIEREK
jgi:Ca2+-dependent lipid-binding protein